MTAGRIKELLDKLEGMDSQGHQEIYTGATPVLACFADYDHTCREHDFS